MRQYPLRHRIQFGTLAQHLSVADAQNGKIAEFWLASTDQYAEDEFVS